LPGRQPERVRQPPWPGLQHPALDALARVAHVGFIVTTVYGQLISVYEYPQAALLILGGSTVAAPLLPIRQLDSAAACHACGRCSGHRGAIALTARSPNAEILAARPAAESSAVLLVFVMLGVAVGAFQWTISPLFVTLKQAAAEWLVAQDAWGLLEGTARRLGPATPSREALAMALVPVAAAGLLLGLTMTTVGHLRAEAWASSAVGPVRVVLLAAGTAWSAALAWKLLGMRGAAGLARLAAWAWCCLPLGLAGAA
jgi:hypothetical protein